MKTVDVEFYPSEGGLSEIYQQTGFHFAFVTAPKNGNKQACKMVKCRDFLHDAVRAAHQGNSCSIFGFAYNAKSDPPIDLRRMRMLVQKPDLAKGSEKEFEEKMKAGLKMLNHYERMAKVSLSKLFKVKAKDKNGKTKRETYLFVGPVFWMKSPFLTSMYTFLIRLGDKMPKFKTHKELLEEFDRIAAEFKKAGKGDNDLNYLAACKEVMDLVVKNAKSLLFQGGKADPLLDSKVGINSYHDRGGIVSLCKGIAFDNGINTRIGRLKAAKAKKK